MQQLIHNSVMDRLATEHLSDWLSFREGLEILKGDDFDEAQAFKDWTYKELTMPSDYPDYEDRLKLHEEVVEKYRPHKELKNAKGFFNVLFGEFRWKGEVKGIIAELHKVWQLGEQILANVAANSDTPNLGAAFINGFVEGATGRSCSPAVIACPHCGNSSTYKPNTSNGSTTVTCVECHKDFQIETRSGQVHGTSKH